MGEGWRCGGGGGGGGGGGSPYYDEWHCCDVTTVPVTAKQLSAVRNWQVHLVIIKRNKIAWQTCTITNKVSWT